MNSETTQGPEAVCFADYNSKNCFSRSYSPFAAHSICRIFFFFFLLLMYFLTEKETSNFTLWLTSFSSQTSALHFWMASLWRCEICLLVFFCDVFRSCLSVSIEWWDVRHTVCKIRHHQKGKVSRKMMGKFFNVIIIVISSYQVVWENLASPAYRGSTNLPSQIHS